ncbi:DMT family transporter [Microvirga lotononidis]|uniref:DMT(Drug/metabolite transporter) superfamily permease n=1 Tax=Microvirga lotononidis TaxID=864069 RepID=I4YT88_9HYPH|nr:DMT family transporter [Microvirga lotononidis]EIM27180.1 DMT(drug/metabolite transporter) superfamily permease [Microvirga lotononidis]WQO28639.1 DMT family transporter [Microvirga lotononidis]
MAAGPDSQSGAPPVPLWVSAGWLLLDMALVTTMQALVKAEGETYPAIQLVFLRSLVGFISVAPLVWRHRRKLADLSNIRGHLTRVAFNSAALTLNFAAFAALPLALVTAIGFTRPLLLLAMAAMMLGERVSGIRYAFTALGFVGVIIMVQPDAIPWNMGLVAAFGSVFFGTLAVVQTRRLAGENTVVLMLFYTVGLTLLTSIPAALAWVPIPWSEAPSIILVGVLAQLGQYCWLQAYQKQEARLLAPIGYLSILFSGFAGWLYFGEIPSLSLCIGAAIVVLTTVLATPAERWLKARNRA